MTIGTALVQGTKLLEEAAVAMPRLTAEVLLAHAIGCDRTWLFAHSSDELSEIWWIHYGRYLHERIGGKPAQYITHHQEFYGREFHVTRDVLIPRPETEHVVEAALARFTHGPVLDVGTGSGALAVTLALETGARMVATDISIAALKIAAINARTLGGEIGFLACDLGAALTSGQFAMIVCNPPYVPEKDREGLQREIRDFEPDIAVFGGEDGLALYRRLIPEANRLLLPGGWLIMELAYNAAEGVNAMLEGWLEIEVKQDLAGLPRVISARKSP
jgi:release factor glutamine methyltransferase